MRCLEHFLDTEVFGEIIEVDAGGLYKRPKPEYNSVHQQWMHTDETANTWVKAGTLGNASVKL
jgi:hypothetical protein